MDEGFRNIGTERYEQYTVIVPFDLRGEVIMHDSEWGLYHGMIGAGMGESDRG